MEYFSTGVTKDKLMVLHGLKALGRTPRMSWKRRGL